MALPNQFEELSKQLPADVFQHFGSLIAPEVFEDTEVIQMQLPQFKSAHDWVSYWDTKLSTVFNFANDLISSHARAYKNVVESILNRQPLFLYLRDFHFTRQPIHYSECSDGSLSYVKPIPMLTYGLQHMLAESSEESGARVVAVRHLAGLTEGTSMLPYADLPSLLLADDTWQSVVETLIEVANGIMLHLGPLGSGTGMEIELIRKYQRQERTVVAIEQYPSEFQSELSHVLEQITGALFSHHLHAPASLNQSSIDSNLSDFPAQYCFESNGLLVEKHQAISKLLEQDRRENHDVTLEQLQEKVSANLEFSRLYSNAALNGLSDLARHAEQLAEKNSGTTHALLAKYCEAACLTLLGKPDVALYAYGSIAVMIHQLMLNDENGALYVSKNVGRMAACLCWSGLEPDSELAKSKAVSIFRSTVKNLLG